MAKLRIETRSENQNGFRTTGRWWSMVACCGMLLTLSFSSELAAALQEETEKAPEGTAFVDEAETAEATTTQEDDTAKDSDAAASDDKKKKASKKKPPKTVLTKKGPIQELAEPSAKLFGMTMAQGQLNFAIPTSYQTVDPIVDSIREVAGWGGGSSSGGNGYNFGLNSEKISGYIRRAKVDKTHVSSVLYQEITKPNRSLNVKVSDDGSTQITINSSEEAFILRIRQASDGQFLVQQLNGTEVFAGSAGNFEMFCRQYREYSAQQLIPAFKHFGLGQLMTPYSPEVLERVTELVSPWQPEELTRIKELTAALDSNVYAEREAAAKELDKNFKGNEALLARMVLDRRFDIEARVVARKIVHDKTDKDKLAKLEFIESLAGNLDASYMLDLIKAQSDEKKRDVLIQRLRELEPDLLDPEASNSDVVAMVTSQAINAWASEQVGKSATESAIDPLTEKGHLQKISAHTQQLLSLIWKDDQLVLDHEHWKKPFNGRSIKELSKDVEKLMKENNLPKAWFNQGGPSHAASSVHHPHVLFEKMQEDCGSQTQNSHYAQYSHHYNGNRQLNRSFDLSHLKADMAFNKSGGGGSASDLEKLPFQLVLTEQEGPIRTLQFNKSKEGDLRIMMAGDKANYIVQLIVKKDQAMIQDVRGNAVHAFKAESFRKLQEEHAEYFRESFFPLLRHFGVLVAPDIDAGADAQETTLNKSEKELTDQSNAIASGK